LKQTTWKQDGDDSYCDTDDRNCELDDLDDFPDLANKVKEVNFIKLIEDKS